MSLYQTLWTAGGRCGDRTIADRAGRVRIVPGEGSAHGAKDHAGHGTHGKSAVGHGTGGQGVVGKEDLAAGKRNPASIKKGGKAWKNLTGFMKRRLLMIGKN